LTSESWPRVSVVIPAYNSEKTIARAIQSALAQEYPSVEILVVDDGSSDRTRQAVEKFGPPVHYLWQENRGAAAARNRGILAAQGEFVAFLDADDEWLSGRIREGVAPMLQDASIGSTFCRLYRVYPDGSRDIYGEAYEKCRTFPRLLWPSGYVQTSAATCRKSALDQVGYFDESLRSHEDLDLWIRLEEAFQVREIEKPLVLFHETSGSLSKRWDRIHAEEDYFIIIERALQRRPDRYLKHRKVLLADAHLFWGIYYVAGKDFARARVHLRKSFSIVPKIKTLSLWLATLLPGKAVGVLLKTLKRLLNRK
jgi:glycosyltransferase involved in cell wall biosynthesis